MRVYVQVKQLGKRKCNIEKIPVDFPVPPVSILLMFFGNSEEMDLIYPWSIVIIHCLE